MARALPLERLATYTLAELGSSDDALDGPFVVASGGFGLLVSLVGKDGGAMPSPSTLRWRRELPPAFASAPCHVFLRRDDRALCLGPARVRRKGSLPRDGFKVELVLDEPPDEATWRTWVAEATAPAPPAPTEALAALGRDATTEARMAAIAVFVARWFGPPVDTATRPASGSTRALVTALPEPLLRFHALVAGRPVSVQNRLVALDELASDAEGRVSFYVENQGVYTWACDAASAQDGARASDPAVLVRGSEHTRTWQLEADHLSSFLVQLLVLECTFGAPFTAHHDALDARGLARLVKRVRPLALPAWKTTGTRFFGSDGVIGLALPNGPDWSVWLGATDRRHVEHVTPWVQDWPHLGW